MNVVIRVLFLSLFYLPSLGQTCNDVLHGCKELPLKAHETLHSYDELLKRKSLVECLTIRNDFFDDTACVRHLDLKKFENLKAIYIDFGKSDSSTQKKQLDDLKELHKLESLGLHTTFKHNYAGFANLKKIWIHQFLLNNPSLTTLKNLEELHVSPGNCIVSPNDPMFSIETIKTLEISTIHENAFPYAGIGNFDQLEVLIIQGTDLPQFYPEWNDLQNLKWILIDQKGLQQLNFNKMDLKKLKNLTLIHFSASYLAPIFDPASFSETKLKIRLELNHLDKSQERRIKKYAKRAEKKYNRKVTFIRKRDDPMNGKTTLIIEGLKEI